ncbi:MAG: SGNH/GDSL hydrolase family protein [Planctomycetaceae bacterium]
MSEPRSHQGTAYPTLKLLALGDCNTRGTADGESLVGHLAQRLQAAGFPCEAVNWGHTMTTTREGLARIRRDRPYADLAMVNYGLVDSWITTVPQFYVPYFPETWSRSYCRKLLKFAKRRLRSPWIERWVPKGAVVSLEEYGRNLNAVITGLRCVNPAIVCVLWSTPPVQGNAARNVHIARYNARMASIASAAGCVFIDSAAVLRSQSAANAYVDAVHLSGASFRLLGSAIYAELLPHRTGAGTSAEDHVAA